MDWSLFFFVFFFQPHLEYFHSLTCKLSKASCFSITSASYLLLHSSNFAELSYARKEKSTQSESSFSQPELRQGKMCVCRHECLNATKEIKCTSTHSLVSSLACSIPGFKKKFEGQRVSIVNVGMSLYRKVMYHKPHLIRGRTRIVNTLSANSSCT